MTKFDLMNLWASLIHRNERVVTSFEVVDPGKSHASQGLR